jgi:hypothetical protein
VPEFKEGFDRLETLVHNAADAGDFEELAGLAYRLSILLPFFEDPSSLDRRRAQVTEYERLRAAKRGKGLA